jgi:heterodisulfide reductase subunit C
MKVKIVIDGVQYDMPDDMISENWWRCTNCSACFLRYVNCANLCQRVFLEKTKRNEL